MARRRRGTGSDLGPLVATSQIRVANLALLVLRATQHPQGQGAEGTAAGAPGRDHGRDAVGRTVGHCARDVLLQAAAARGVVDCGEPRPLLWLGRVLRGVRREVDSRRAPRGRAFEPTVFHVARRLGRGCLDRTHAPDLDQAALAPHVGAEGVLADPFGVAVVRVDHPELAAAVVADDDRGVQRPVVVAVAHLDDVTLAGVGRTDFDAAGVLEPAVVAGRGPLRPARGIANDVVDEGLALSTMLTETAECDVRDLRVVVAADGQSRPWCKWRHRENRQQDGGDETRDEPHPCTAIHRTSPLSVVMIHNAPI